MSQIPGCHRGHWRRGSRERPVPAECLRLTFSRLIGRLSTLSAERLVTKQITGGLHYVPRRIGALYGFVQGGYSSARSFLPASTSCCARERVSPVTWAIVAYDAPSSWMARAASARSWPACWAAFSYLVCSSVARAYRSRGSPRASIAAIVSSAPAGPDGWP